MDRSWRLRRNNIIMITASQILRCLWLFRRNLDRGWSQLHFLQFFCNLYYILDKLESWYTMFAILVFHAVPRRYTCEYFLLVSLFFVWHPQVNSDIFEIIFFMTSKTHVKVCETYWTSFLRNSIFFLLKLLIFVSEKNFLTLWAQVWCLDFLRSHYGRYYFHHYCFSNSHIWLKFLKNIGVKIRFCFSLQADYSSIVEQNCLTNPYVFDVDLCLSSNGLLHFKSN